MASENKSENKMTAQIFKHPHSLPRQKSGHIIKGSTNDGGRSVDSGNMLLLKIDNTNDIGVTCNIKVKFWIFLDADDDDPSNAHSFVDLELDQHETRYIMYSTTAEFNKVEDEAARWLVNFDNVARKDDFDNPVSLWYQIMNNSPTYSFIGEWDVRIGTWNGVFCFQDGHKVFWKSSASQERTYGHWRLEMSKDGRKIQRLTWKFSDQGDIRTFVVERPLTAVMNGVILPAGQGFFHMEKLFPD